MTVLAKTGLPSPSRREKVPPGPIAAVKSRQYTEESNEE